MPKQKKSIKKLASHFCRSYQEIEAILDRELFCHDKPMEDVENLFEKKLGEFYLKADSYQWFQERILIKYHRVQLIDSSNILGHTLTTYSDGVQKFFDTIEVYDAFKTTGYELYTKTNFYDTTMGYVVNQSKDNIKHLVTESGVLLFLHLSINDAWDRMACA